MNALGFAPTARLQRGIRLALRRVTSFSPAATIAMLSESIQSLVLENAERF